jgi:membrane associated rhomboid family serine protease
MEITKTVKQLLIINIVLFALTLFKSPLILNLVLWPLESGYFQVHQLITYMFLHGGVTHILFNMIGLVIFGSELEKEFGQSKFLKIYFLSGIVAGISHIFFIDSPVVGASGAVWGLMVMYTFINPDRIFHVYFFIPAKIKYIVSVLFILEIYSSFFINDVVAHIAHIGGALTGFTLYRFLK